MDGHQFERDYTALVFGLLSVAALIAVLSLVLGAAVSRSETTGRDRTLAALGVDQRDVNAIRRATTTLPALVATALRAVAGVLVGVSYLALSDYPQLSGALRGFPIRIFAVAVVVELLTILGIGALGSTAARIAQDVDAGALAPLD